MVVCNHSRFIPLLLLILLSACATYSPQYLAKPTGQSGVEKEPAHTFYLAGGFGDLEGGPKKDILDLLASELDKAPNESTLIFTGDNITPEANNWDSDKELIEKQLDLLENFKGQTIFIPGNNEWKSNDTKKIEKEEEYLDDHSPENVKLFPKNTCPIEHKVINDELDIILIDSKWFISNWSRIEDINKKCTDIVTRRRFVEELEGYINDGQGKNIVIVMHHPIFSNGKFAARETFKSHMTPLPILGTLLNTINDLSGFDPDRLNSRRYSYLRILVSSLAKASDRITVVSGHEESLQYLSGGNIQQIISGSLASKTATKRSVDRIVTIGGTLPFEGIFTYGEVGFAKLEYFKDGSSRVTFISPDQLPGSSRFNVLPKFSPRDKPGRFPEISAQTKAAPVIKDEFKLKKSGLYKFIWGERYRDYYGKDVTVPIANLDTLYGGLKVLQEGGGHQSYSLRLADDMGKEYAMRSLRKNALKFLKYKVKGIAFTEDDYKNTWTEELVSDFFTTAHPYMQLVIPPLAKVAGINHAETNIFYVPAQKALGDLNGEYGNELYFIEERPSEQQSGYEGYTRSNPDEEGKIKDFESTTDVLEKITSDESYEIDQKSYIRARIFDMLIGDWDRHEDQWRWAEYETKDNEKIFLPIPRDRDNSFSKFDGIGIPLIQLFVPDTRFWQSYDDKLNNVKWFNAEGNNLDRTIFTKYGPEIWEEEAKALQQNITSEVIEKAFLRLPEEVRDSSTEKIKRNLKVRLQKLPEYARKYSQYLDKLVTLHGTEKDDQFKITRLPDGKTKVVIRRLLTDDPNEKIYERTFERDHTREIWIYGLGDDDIFVVEGEGDHNIYIRIIGGYGKDTYSISNDNSLKIYDWKHEISEFKEKTPLKQLTNLYETNTFHWRFFNENNNTIVPNLGYRSDEGFYYGATDTYTYNGINGNPFRQKHAIAAKYYSQFDALELSYNGIFGNVIPGWNFELNGYFNTDKYVYNFFGIGNETQNLEDGFGRDYYRSQLQRLILDAGIAFHTLRFKAIYESMKVLEQQDRLSTPSNLDPEVFELQNYAGVETSLNYSHDDAEDFPAKAIYFGLSAGYKLNLENTENKFGYLSFKVGISHKLIPSGDLVLGSVAEVKSNFGDTYYFYHAPSIGGINGLRGFRDERFTGKTYFYQTSDIRLRIKQYITALAPITVGVFGGFDYGRVWTPNDASLVWHTSQGGGVWVGGYNFLSFSAGVFNSVEGNIVRVGFGFGF